MKLTLFIFFLVSFQSFSQSEWSMQQCIDSALIKNQEIRISSINLSQAEVNHRNSIYTFFPTLNGGVTHGYNWGQTIDPFTNQFATDRVQYNSFYLNSSVVLFSGLENIHLKKLLTIDLEYNQVSKALIERNVKIEIVTAFLQVVLNEELVAIDHKAVKLTLEEQKRIQALISEEQITTADLLKINAQLAKEEHTLQQAKNEHQYSLLLLQQLIGLDYNSAFSISYQPIIMLNESIPNSELSLEVQLGSLNIDRQEISIKKTKGQLSPKIYLNGSLGSGYSENNKILASNGSFVPKKLNNQLDENFYQSASVTLSIPIFNNNRIKTEIKIDELQADRTRIENAQKIKAYEDRIEQFNMQISNTQSLVKTLNIVLKSSQLDFQNSKHLFEARSINFVEFLRSKNALYVAEFELIQANYKAFFLKQILFFL